MKYRVRRTLAKQQRWCYYRQPHILPEVGGDGRASPPSGAVPALTPAGDDDIRHLKELVRASEEHSKALTRSLDDSQRRYELQRGRLIAVAQSLAALNKAISCVADRKNIDYGVGVCGSVSQLLTAADAGVTAGVGFAHLE